MPCEVVSNICERKEKEEDMKEWEEREKNKRENEKKMRYEMVREVCKWKKKKDEEKRKKKSVAQGSKKVCK